PALPGAAERAGLTAAGWPAVLAGAPVRTAAAAPAALPLVAAGSAARVKTVVAAPAALPLVAAGSAAPVKTVVAAPVALPLVAVGSAVPVKTVAAAPAALPLVAAGSAVPVKTAAVVRVGPSVAVAAVPAALYSTDPGSRKAAASPGFRPVPVSAGLELQQSGGHAGQVAAAAVPATLPPAAAPAAWARQPRRIFRCALEPRSMPAARRRLPADE